jgi:hypothetical protein
VTDWREWISIDCSKRRSATSRYSVWRWSSRMGSAVRWKRLTMGVHPSRKVLRSSTSSSSGTVSSSSSTSREVLAARTASWPSASSKKRNFSGKEKYSWSRR